MHYNRLAHFPLLLLSSEGLEHCLTLDSWRLPNLFVDMLAKPDRRAFSHIYLRHALNNNLRLM